MFLAFSLSETSVLSWILHHGAPSLDGYPRWGGRHNYSSTHFDIKLIFTLKEELLLKRPNVLQGNYHHTVQDEVLEDSLLTLSFGKWKVDTSCWNDLMYNRKNSRLRWRTWVRKRPLEFGARRCTEERGRYECDTCIQGMAPYALLTATMPTWHGGSGTLSTLPVERAAVLVGGDTPKPLFFGGEWRGACVRGRRWRGRSNHGRTIQWKLFFVLCFIVSIERSCHETLFRARGATISSVSL